jgi:hypothetical protein
MLKRCSRCKQEKKHSDFSKDKRLTSGYQSACKMCRRDEQLLLKFGITQAEYDVLLKKQNGVCAICHQEETAIRKGQSFALAVDHDHQSNLIRGLLCVRCNVAVERFAQYPDAFISYLKS